MVPCLPFLFLPGRSSQGACYMKISAAEELRANDMFDRNFEMYRDLSLALRDRITLLKVKVGEDPACRDTLEAIKAHNKALQTVLELEVGLARQSRIRGAGEGGGELDLAAARAEIAQRLAAWAGEG